MEARRILVPVNGTAADQSALELAAMVAQKTKARIFAVFVIRVARSLPLDADIDGETRQGELVLESAVALARKAGVQIETDLLQSRELGSAIVDEAVERACDLVIMGVLNERKFGEFDLGQTAAYVLENAPCRVWICREATGDTA